ncbi:MAG: response regulator [Lentisphaerae bacterium]|nr:response regulator [Lentisphaerota bacterium]
MDEKILLVDDDANLLAAFQRQLRHRYNAESALNADAALDIAMTRGPFAVVISDLRMPGMDGIQFLSRIKERAPHTVRIMLTGNADLQTAIDSVNEGNIFRFLTKPCPPETMEKVIAAGVEQYRLITAEKVLLERTLGGGIKVLTDVLSLVNPTAFGRANRLQRFVRLMVNRLNVSNAWEIEMAALLSQVGCVTVPEPVLHKAFAGGALSFEERKMMEAHPQVAHDLIVNIPRLEGVAEAIAFQEKRFDGTGSPPENRAGDAIPLGARILKLILDFDALESRGVSRRKALAVLAGRAGWYEPALLRTLEDVIISLEVGDHFRLKEVALGDLAPGMIFAEDVFSGTGLLLISKGQDVTQPILMRLRNFAFNAGMRGPLRVLIPRDAVKPAR